MASTHQWPQLACDAPNASTHHQNFQLIIDKLIGTYNLIEKKKLSKNLKPTINKQPNSYWPHTCITLLIPKLVLHIMTQIDMVVNITLNNNQYPLDWFKTH